MNKELKSLIDQYCMGMKPTEAQEIEIFDKVAETGADIKEVSSYMTEMQNGPTKEERLAAEEAERKAKEEAERKAKEDAERIAKEKAEKAAKAKAEREAKKAADRKTNRVVEKEAKTGLTVAKPKHAAKVADHNASAAKRPKATIPCPYCGEKIPANSKSCPNCVQDIKQTGRYGKKETEPIKEDSKEVKKSHLSDYVIGGIIALLLLYALYYNVVAPMLK